MLSIRRLAALVLVGVTLAALSACQSRDPINAPAPSAARQTLVRVDFEDSSVPPAYHRSWHLEAAADRVSLQVDSYGDVVATESAPMPAATWGSYVDRLPGRLSALPAAVPDAERCPGDTSLTLTISRSGDDSVDRTISVGSCEDGELIDAMLQLLEPLTSQVHLERNTRTG